MSEGKSCPEDDQFCVLDPRAAVGENVDTSTKGQKYSEVIVFVVGGGCYSEFYNLQDLLKAKGGGGALRSVMYGCSELLSGDEFLSQLERLGGK